MRKLKLWWMRYRLGYVSAAIRNVELNRREDDALLARLLAQKSELEKAVNWEVDHHPV